MLESDIFVAHLVCRVDGCLQYGVGLAAQVWFASCHFGQVVNLFAYGGLDKAGIDVEFLEDILHHVLAAADDAHEDVRRFDLLLAFALHKVHRALYRLLGLDCKVVEIHIIILLFVSFSITTPHFSQLICHMCPARCSRDKMSVPCHRCSVPRVWPAWRGGVLSCTVMMSLSGVARDVRRDCLRGSMILVVG